MTLDQLSAAATQGEWVADNHVIMLSPATTVACLENFNQWGDRKPTGNEANDAVFICALVNAYRTGHLVKAQPDDATVERVINSRHDMELRFTVRFSEKDFIKFGDVIAAMPSQAALQGEMETPSPYRCKHGCERDALKDLNHAQAAEIERLKSRLAHVEKMYVQEAISKGPKL